jgi:hypothetical protein
LVSRGNPELFSLCATLTAMQLAYVYFGDPRAAAKPPRGRFQKFKRCASRISSVMLVRESRTSSAKGAFGRHDRHDNAGMRLLTAASG